MPGLEATLVINAKDNTSGALASIEKVIAALEKQVAAFDKMASVVAQVSRAIDPLASSFSATERALAGQREAATAAAAGLERLEGAGTGAAASQGKLRSEIQRTSGALKAQGEAAARASRAVAERGHGGGLRGAVGGILPFEGPEILEKTKEAIKAGATLQEEIARLTAAGAKPEEIAQARKDFLEFSKSHSGTLESEYLGTYRDARMIAPDEPFEQAKLGMRYLAAGRNSGMSLTEYDAGNVMRSMDELGLKNMPAREKFLDKLMKVQQAFGSQVTTETYLTTLRNAGMAIYKMSDEFRDELLPTLIQSAGQRGGTEMMTSLNNFIGHHMQLSELKALIGAGFVKNSDLYYEHNKPLLKDKAKLFEADTFLANPFQWAEDFHREYMSRPGSTEEGFDALIAKMPRSMSAMISFFTANHDRLRRDQKSLHNPIGLAAESDDYLAKNPVAGLDALRTSIEQFAAAATNPLMLDAGKGLQQMAHGIQMLSSAYSEFAAAHPDLAKAGSAAAVGAGLAGGGYLTWKLFSGIGKLFGLGGGGAAGEGGAALTGGAVAGGGASGLGLLGAPVVIGMALAELFGPRGPWGAYWRPPTSGDFPDDGMLERSRRSGLTYENGAWVRDPEAARGRAYHDMAGGDLKVSLDPNSRAAVDVKVTVAASSNFFDLVTSAVARATGSLEAHLGTMNTDAAPRRIVGHGGAYSP